MPERRKNQRVSEWFPVEIESDRRSRMAVVKDSSDDGVLLASSGRFEVGEVVNIHSRPPRDGSRRVMKRGVVVRTESDDQVDIFPHQVAVRIHTKLAKSA